MNIEEIERTLSVATANIDDGAQADAWKRAYANDVQALLQEIVWLTHEYDRLKRSWEEEHAVALRWRFHNPGGDYPG